MRPVLLFACLALAACSGSVPAPAPLPSTSEAADLPPDWAAHAVWYQIFPERFRNGDPSNDPTPESVQGAWPKVPTDTLELIGWEPTPWNWDWYAQEPWAEAYKPGEFYITSQMRRYGGDLAGILEGLDYIESLGVNALYLNPLNDSPSLHKYDARTWRHVDPHFGPDPEGDKAIIATEDPLDPSTWQFTAADQMFLQLIREAHARGIRVVLDYSWNHTGDQFWGFLDAAERGAESPYADWFTIEAFDDPATPENEFAYKGWLGISTLPEIRKTDQTGDPHLGIPYDGDMDEAASQHVFAISRRWLDPNGDGDPSDGVDGFRLDVAEMVPLGFWRRYRDVVKEVNPEAILVGEIWWQQWPEIMMPPAPYLGDVFDSVMHYRPFAPTRQLVAPGGPQIAPSAYAAHLDSLYGTVQSTHVAALMAMSGSHDTPRLASTLYNTEIAYKYEENPRFHPSYRIDQPDRATMRSVRLYRLLQVTLPGAPHVYYGDELGMWGADDPDDRKPMLWPEIDYATETTHPFGLPRDPDPIEIDGALLDDTREVLDLRREFSDLFAHGALLWRPDDERQLLVFERRHMGQVATVAVNLSPEPQTVQPPDGARLALFVGSVEAGRLGARAAAVWVKTP
ncbi:MAG: alpha-amylase family glycosyl hydrolase [Bacteroidota bacterium]